MRRLVIAACAVLLLGQPIISMADDGFTLDPPSTPGGDYEAPRESLIDEWNADEAHYPIGIYSGGCFAYPYDPPIEYDLERVEFIAGGVGGQATVQVRADDYNGAVLGEVTYTESSATGWQGENLVPAVHLTPGSVYFLIYHVVPNGDASTAETGTVVPYYYASDCSSYGQLFEHIYWKARFYGTGGTATDVGTWGRIKGLYR